MNVLNDLKDSCGVFAIYSFSKNPVSIRIYNGLTSIQHRGQDSAGMSVFSSDKILTKKSAGLVSDVFGEKDINRLKGHIGIGHVRYPTTGHSVEEDAQPFVINHPMKGIALAHNGNIANLTYVNKLIRRRGRSVSSSCDAEFILHCIADELVRSKGNIWTAVKNTMKILDGSYVVVMMTGEGQLVAFRDPLGIKPLCMGRDKDRIVFASESTALDINNMALTRDVRPGEAIIVSKRGVRSRVLLKRAKHAHCMFEYVYFSRPDSILDKRSVYNVRFRLGQILAQNDSVKADVVVPVPDTSRPAASGYSYQSGIPVAEGLIKNRYVARTFIMPDQTKRSLAVRLKLNALRSILYEKRVVLIDDSIVRGTTLKPIIGLLKSVGTKEIHVRITCPPITSPCFYGINIPTYEELSAYKHSVEEIRKEAGCDSLVYMDTKGLLRAIGMPKSKLCIGCISDKYPTREGNVLAKKIKTSKGCKDIRCWETME
ncbi:MAG: amidophosphoribosyltransferase [Candidatus Micrarchaeota archaeon]